MNKGNELELGLAGEHLVCAELLGQNLRAFRTEQNCPYDVALEYKGRLIRIQVRCTEKPKPYPQKRQNHITGYTWYIRMGKGARKSHNPNSFDILALVAFDTRKIAYFPRNKVRITMQIPVSGAKSQKGRRFENFPLSAALEEVCT